MPAVWEEHQPAIKLHQSLLPLLQQAGVEAMQRVIFAGPAISCVERFEVLLAIVVFVDGHHAHAACNAAISCRVKSEYPFQLGAMMLRLPNGT